MKKLMIIFSGLPGTGKTTISKEIATYFHAVYFRLDTIEHAMNELCNLNVQGEGYRLTYRIAAENLSLGNSVVIDCCNPCELTRNEWESVALERGCPCVNVEITCSDKDIHKERVENRDNDIPGFKLPSWENVTKRDYEKWHKDVIRIETANRTVSECVNELLKKLQNLSVYIFSGI